MCNNNNQAKYQPNRSFLFGKIAIFPIHSFAIKHIIAFAPMNILLLFFDFESKISSNNEINTKIEQFGVPTFWLDLQFWLGYIFLSSLSASSFSISHFLSFFVRFYVWRISWGLRAVRKSKKKSNHTQTV